LRQSRKAVCCIVIESDLGFIELEVHGDVKIDAAIIDPLAHAHRCAERDLEDELMRSNAVAKMPRLSLPEYEEDTEENDV
jgi:hypothetical protein